MEIENQRNYDERNKQLYSEWLNRENVVIDLAKKYNISKVRLYQIVKREQQERQKQANNRVETAKGVLLSNG